MLESGGLIRNLRIRRVQRGRDSGIDGCELRHRCHHDHADDEITQLAHVTRPGLLWNFPRTGSSGAPMHTGGPPLFQETSQIAGTRPLSDTPIPALLVLFSNGLASPTAVKPETSFFHVHPVTTFPTGVGNSDPSNEKNSVSMKKPPPPVVGGSEEPVQLYALSTNRLVKNKTILSSIL